MISLLDHELALDKERQQLEQERAAFGTERAKLLAELDKQKKLFGKTLANVREKSAAALVREKTRSAVALTKEKARHQDTKDKYIHHGTSKKQRISSTNVNENNMSLADVLTDLEEPNTDNDNNSSNKRPRTSNGSAVGATVAMNSSKQPNGNDLKWNHRLTELQAFKELNGHCNVPRINSNVRLACWVSTQRSNHTFMRDGKPHSLTPERIQLLNRMGFKWRVAKYTGTVTWEERVEQLQAFYLQEGHANVPQRYPPGKHPPGLGDFVLIQRKKYREGKLDAKRVLELEEMCPFQWSLRDRGGTLEERMQKQSATTTQSSNVARSASASL
jgi:hypothetical protein